MADGDNPSDPPTSYPGPSAEPQSGPSGDPPSLASGSPNGEKLAQFALSQVHKYLKQQDDGRAFANYLLVLKLQPEHASTHKSSFLECLRRWSRTLVTAGRVTDMLTCHHEACSVLQDCPELLNGLGTQLYSLGFPDEAAGYFRKALSADDTFSLARHNLQNVLGLLVERWHFRMLNDKGRNKAYRAAIHRAVAAGHNTVLDIGAGTGLLSMFAADAGAASVYAVEMSKTMCDVCRECVSQNQATDAVTVIHNKSTELEVPRDIPTRCSLLVTETFDAGLLGEHILTTLDHAWEHLLVNSPSNKARVIPRGAQVYVCAIECETIRKQNRSIYPGVRHLDFGDCAFYCETCESTRESVEPDQRQSDGNHGDIPADTDGDSATPRPEPYTSHRLTDLPGGYKTLSQKLRATEFIFDDPQCVRQYQSGFSTTLTVPITTNGQLDALALWFDLDLDDTVTLTSDPDSGSCWEQAVYPVLPSHLQGHSSTSSLLVRQGDQLTFTLRCRDNALHLEQPSITRHHPEGAPRPSSHPAEGPSSAGVCALLPLSGAAVSRLNDLEWSRAYCRAIEARRGPGLTALCLVSDWSTLPLQALAVGAVAVCAVTEERRGLCALAAINRLDPRRLQIAGAVEDVAGRWELLVVAVVEATGALRQQVLGEVALARMTCLSPAAVVVPHSVTIYGVLVDSPSLLADSKVMDDDNTLGVKVATVINHFQMPHHLDIHLSTLDHKRLSQPFQLLTFDLNQPLEADSDLAATFLQQEATFAVSASESGRVTAVVYWFDLLLSPTVTYSTLDSSSHIHQAAIVVGEPIAVDCGEELIVRAVCKNSCLDVTVSTATER